MNNKITFISLLLIALVLPSCFAQYQTISFSETDRVSMIFDDLNGTQTELYIKANDWMVSTFVDATSVIQFSDKESGVLMGKYLLNGEVRSAGYMTIDTRVYAKIDIRVKDNKAKIEIEPIGSWQYDPSGRTIYNYSKMDALLDMSALAQSLESRLRQAKDDF